MRYRIFGRTGLRVSELVFGGGWVGGVLIHQDDATKLKTLRRAMHAGINWIDTAPIYGVGHSESRRSRQSPRFSRPIPCYAERLKPIFCHTVWSNRSA